MESLCYSSASVRLFSVVSLTPSGIYSIQMARYTCEGFSFFIFFFLFVCLFF